MSLILKRKNNSGDITAYDDAVLTYTALGDGVLDKVYDGLQARLSNGIITITSGIILFGGRIIEISKGSTLTLDITSIPQSSAVYVVCELVIASDDEDSRVSIYAATVKPTQTNPINGAGTHKTVLFTLAENSRIITENFTRLEPGVAKNALNLLSGGKIGNAAFSSIFLDDMSGVRYAHRADVAAEAEGFVGGDINKVSSNLYMPNRGVYLLQEAILVRKTSAFTVAPGQSYKFPETGDNSPFPILKGRNKVLLLAKESTSDDLDILNPTNGLIRGTPISGFQIKGLDVKINEGNSNLNSGSVVLTNQTASTISVNGLQMKFYLYGGN